MCERTCVDYMQILHHLKRLEHLWVLVSTAVLEARGEAKEGGSQGQEIKAILANMVKPHLY